MAEGTDEEFNSLVRQNYPETAEDYTNSALFINSFFERTIVSNMSNWSICVEVERKGAAIFEEQKVINKTLNILYSIHDEEIAENGILISNKSILVFDDSIREGIKIRSILETLKCYNPGLITVATIIAKKESLEKLKEDYKEVSFLSALIVPSEEFGQNYTKKIFPYLEYICLPLQKDHPIMIIEFADHPEEDAIFKFFSLYGDVISNDFICSGAYNDREKKALILKSSSIEQVDILRLMEGMGLLDKDSVIMKVRIYLRKGRNSILYLQPMLVEGYVAVADAQIMLDQDSIQKIDTLVKRLFLSEFLVKKFLIDFLITRFPNISNFAVRF